MSRRPLTSEETKVRNWLLSGKSVNATASMLGIGKQKINNKRAAERAAAEAAAKAEAK